MEEDSKYKIGDQVHINRKLGSTPKDGIIYKIIWHHKEDCYNYYIKDLNGKKISKRYFEAEMEINHSLS